MCILHELPFIHSTTSIYLFIAWYECGIAHIVDVCTWNGWQLCVASGRAFIFLFLLQFGWTKGFLFIYSFQCKHGISYDVEIAWIANVLHSICKAMALIFSINWVQAELFGMFMSIIGINCWRDLMKIYMDFGISVNCVHGTWSTNWYK